MHLRSAIGVLLSAVTCFAADYQVVLKSSGKIIHGNFVSEDEKIITLQVNQAEVSFKKEKLDLESMKQLNRANASSVPQAAASGSPLDDDKYQALVADEIHHRENSLARAKNFVADCDAKRIQCTQNDYKVAYGQIEDDEHTLKFLKLEHGTSDEREAQELFNRRKEMNAKYLAAERAYRAAEERHAPAEELEALRQQLNRVIEENVAAEKQMEKSK